MRIKMRGRSDGVRAAASNRLLREAKPWLISNDPLRRAAVAAAAKSEQQREKLRSKGVARGRRR